MSGTDYNALLYEKVGAEQEQYKKWLLSQPPEEILKYAYEYSIREDIVIYMEYAEFSTKRAKALLKCHCLIDEIYNNFNKIDVNIMDDIQFCAEQRADELISRNSEKESR